MKKKHYEKVYIAPGRCGLVYDHKVKFLVFPIYGTAVYFTND
jgi:hypothetical protein